MNEERFIQQCEARLRFKQVRELLEQIEIYLTENDLSKSEIIDVHEKLNGLQRQLAIDYFQTIDLPKKE
ncbi:hypothetical protein JZO77_06020 [Enterococcus hulanensis]|uniref:hypothetical protein n=1 Tax=Enterococcus hulanensis TaxID=2559929 RepID=UPI001A9074EA|nr:hypothetical protein [Enterococcus hulanensis]MBO0456294.1 hypothetical protein [Enterococcus hulanensis]